VANFLGDRAIRGLAELSNTIIHWSQFTTGGHFASLQAPDLLVSDIRTFFQDARVRAGSLARLFVLPLDVT
jgi:hypothetical protein